MTRLPNEEIQLLIAAHKITAKRNEADKIKCVIYWGRGYSWEQIKELLFISDDTIKNYIDGYQSGGIEKLKQCNYTGNNNKLSSDKEKILENYVEKYNVLTSKQPAKYVYDKFGIQYTTNGMTKTLIRLGFSYKKPKRAPAK